MCSTLAPTHYIVRACRHVGGIRLLAWTLQNASAHSEFQELAALTAGRLLQGSPRNQDAFLRAGGVDVLQRLLVADWGDAKTTAGVQAAAARALADAMAGNEGAKDLFVSKGKSRYIMPCSMPCSMPQCVVVQCKVKYL